MLRFPNCKINIGLFITSRRNDGYHNLETVFYPVALKDVLEIVPANQESSIHLSGKMISGNSKDNLVWKAFELMKATFPDQVQGFDIYLQKMIPMGAGLGGGSSDGACMLQMINDHCKLHLGQEQLAQLALKLGSDCPFFIYNTPAYATGRGEELQPIALDLSAYSIQLLCPDIHVSTASAFQMLQPRPASFDLRNIASLPIEEWKEKVTNDFENPVFDAHPQLSDLKQQLYEQGALYASMSGSGSSIYGIYNKGKKALINTVPQHFIA